MRFERPESATSDQVDVVSFVPEKTVQTDCLFVILFYRFTVLRSLSPSGEN
jgi:hypothetical protein